VKKIVIVSGAVLMQRSGNRITIKKKCEKCGTVQNAVEVLDVPGRNVTHTERFTCFKCGNLQEIVLQGD
jgi:ribosomal protein S27AE